MIFSEDSSPRYSSRSHEFIVDFVIHAFYYLFCPPIYFVRWNLKHVKLIQISTYFSCELYGEIRNRWKNFVGQNCRNFDLVPKILSAEKFCPPKILSAEILSDKVDWYSNLTIHHTLTPGFVRFWGSIDRWHNLDEFHRGNLTIFFHIYNICTATHSGILRFGYNNCLHTLSSGSWNGRTVLSTLISFIRNLYPSQKSLLKNFLGKFFINFWPILRYIGPF